MAVAKNDSGTNNVNAAAPTTLDLTTFTVLAGSNLLLIGFLHINGTPGTVTLNWDATGTNVAMTQIALSPVINAVRTYVFLLINPATGNLTLRAAGLLSKATALGAIAFSGADQTTGINAAHTLNPTGSMLTNPLSVGPITGSSDGATVGAMSFGNTLDGGTTSQTQAYLNPGAGGGNSVSYNLGGLSNTHTWGSTHSGSWAAMGIHVIAAAAVGGHGFNRQSLAPGCGVPARKSQNWKRKGMIVVPEDID